MSKLEDKIEAVLKRDGISFEREVYLPFAKWKGKLRFDFGIYFNGQLAALIEVQGEQHYKFVSKFFKSEKEFQAAKERDRQKIRAALANSIPLYILPFTDIDSIKNSSQIFQTCYLAKSMWHNDYHNPFESS